MWTGTCGLRILASPGRIMRLSCTASGWLDLGYHDRRDRNRRCRHHIHGEEATTEVLHPEFRPERETHQYRSPPEARQGYRPAAPIQRFNNKSLNWPAWFRHFRADADVHGWSKEQRALQLVSYLDETAMNVTQELVDNDLYNYDVLVKLLSDRFDPASRVSAFQSRFHGRSRRHHEDADAFADALVELCRVGYPQSPPELRQELIAEQFVRGQSDPEHKKYLWVVIPTQKDRKLQTLIEVCTDFSSLVAPTHLHRPAEQTFAVHHHSESYTEEDEELEDVFAIADRPSWNNNRRSPDPSTSPNLQQMFALACRMGYEMRPIARQPDVQRRPPGNRPPPDHNRGFCPQTHTNRDYSRIKCFSCGEDPLPNTGLFASLQTGRLASTIR